MKSEPRTPGVPPVGFGGSFSRPRRNTTKRLPGRAKYALLAFGTVAAVTFAMAWNPPTASVHKFTTASDYRVDRDSGCTNSGEGCHGSETSYADFNAYHPEAECTTCHDYEGVGCIPCHAPREHECAACHDGTMKKAPDRVRITDPYPSGHYRETTHTAMGTAVDTAVRASSGGKASATCEDCHSRDLRAAHTAVPAVEGSDYGPDLGCGECHNDVRSFGQAEVLNDWPKKSCESCHKVGSSSPMHGTKKLAAVEAEDEYGCADSGTGCHSETDLHLLHADAPKSCSGSAKKGEPGCHNLGVEAHVPTAKGCGGSSAQACHRSDDERGYVHKRQAESHSPSTDGPASNRSFAGVPCGGCHYMDNDGSSLVTEHSRSTSAISGVAGDVCVDCHNNEGSATVIEGEWAERNSTNSCAGCHDGRGIDAAHTRALSGVHKASKSEGCASSGAGCHPTADIASIGDPSAGALHSSCLRCHDRTRTGGNMAYTPGAASCGDGRDCHSNGYNTNTSVHSGSGGRADGRDANHTAGRVQRAELLLDPVSGVSASCATCHGATLGGEHSRPNNSLRLDACSGCHNASSATARVVKSDWASQNTDDACAACHNGEAASDAHTDIDSVHSAEQIDADGKSVAGYCSKRGCHGSGDVRKLHAEVGCDVDGCHSATGDIVGDRTMSCGGPKGQDACHAGAAGHEGATQSHKATELDSYGDPVPGSCEAAGCHTTVDVRTIHSQSGCQTPGCHTQDGPAVMTCGGAEGQSGSCHSGSARHSERDARHQAIELDAYGDAAPGTCQRAGCHESVDVRVLHKTTFCATAGCHVVGGPTYMTCGGGEGQADTCHGGASRHPDRTERHQAVEYAPDGSPTPGACATDGCHTTLDVRALHQSRYCETEGCHVQGGPTYMTCGGREGQPNCHLQFEADEHGQSHDAALTGEVAGVLYGPAENVGCLGQCHDSNLIGEHRIRLLGNALEGGGESVCAICHADADGAGAFSGATAVASAVAAGDRRCVSCHSSGSSVDEATAVASPPATCAAQQGLASVEVFRTAIAPRAQAPGTLRTAGGQADTPAQPTDEQPGGSETSTALPPAAPANEPDASSAPVEEPVDDTSDRSCTRTTDESTDTAVVESVPTGNSVCLECHTISD